MSPSPTSQPHEPISMLLRRGEEGVWGLWKQKHGTVYRWGGPKILPDPQKWFHLGLEQ